MSHPWTELDLNGRTRDFLQRAGVKSGMRILDVGSGHGDVAFLAEQLVGSSGQVVSIDHQAKMVERAQERGHERGSAVTFQLGDLSALAVEQAPFDAIVGRRVLMYVPDPVQALTGLAQILGTGGLVAFEELELSIAPMSSCPLPLHDKVYGWFDTMLASESVHRNMGLTLASSMRAAGLTVEEVSAEAVVETETQHQTLAWRLKAMRPRFVQAGVAEEELAHLDDLDERLTDERRDRSATFIGQTAFRCWARLNKMVHVGQRLMDVKPKAPVREVASD